MMKYVQNEIKIQTHEIESTVNHILKILAIPEGSIADALAYFSCNFVTCTVSEIYNKTLVENRLF